jgi:hypothetical protein
METEGLIGHVAVVFSFVLVSCDLGQNDAVAERSQPAFWPSQMGLTLTSGAYQRRLQGGVCLTRIEQVPVRMGGEHSLSQPTVYTVVMYVHIRGSCIGDQS